MKTSKPLRILEFIWIIIGLTGMMLASYTFLQGNNGQATYFFFIAVVSAVMFNVRRKQRKKLEEEITK